MQAGRLKETITVQHTEIQENEYGEQDTVMSKPVKMRADVKYNIRSRYNDGQEIYYDNEVDFIVRIYNQVSDYDIITWKSDTYRILSVNTERDAMRKTLRCQKIQD